MLIALLEVGILEVKYMKMKLCALLAAIGLCAGNLSGCGGKAPAAADTSAAAKSSVGELADVELAEGAHEAHGRGCLHCHRTVIQIRRQKTSKTRSQAASGMR